MKKGFTILFSMLLLVGCSSNNDEQTTIEQEDTPEVIETEDNTDSTLEESDETEVEMDESEEDATDASATNNDHLKDFEEYSVLKDELDLETYTGVVETDNKGNRIILFEDETGAKEFKSIFVKNDNRLKIVQFEDDGLLYNEVLK